MRLCSHSGEHYSKCFQMGSSDTVVRRWPQAATEKKNSSTTPLCGSRFDSSALYFGSSRCASAYAKDTARQDGATRRGNESASEDRRPATAGKLRSAGENRDCGSQLCWRLKP